MYTPPQQEADRFKAGRSAVLPQNRSFLFQMPNELPQNRRCLPDVYPPKRPWRKGLLVFYPSAPSTRRATPFRMSKGRETPAARALCGFFLSRMLGIWYRRNGAFFGFFSSLHKAEGASLSRGPRRNRRKRRCDSEKMEPASGNFRKESNTI